MLSITRGAAHCKIQNKPLGLSFPFQLQTKPTRSIPLPCFDPGRDAEGLGAALGALLSLKSLFQLCLMALGASALHLSRVGLPGWMAQQVGLQGGGVKKAKDME